ncbi:MAG: hypothetical protein CM15mP67_14330 [Alphaproteobacteria bacterium]|nr:MAG: hypothetical protein CM15mP67_14330 [Alphaproteobacteria bacterium]
MPAFALLKAPVYVPENVSPLIKPLYKIDDVFNVATALPSYVLSEAVMPETVNALVVMFAVTVE